MRSIVFIYIPGFHLYRFLKSKDFRFFHIVSSWRGLSRTVLNTCKFPLNKKIRVFTGAALLCLQICAVSGAARQFSLHKTLLDSLKKAPTRENAQWEKLCAKMSPKTGTHKAYKTLNTRLKYALNFRDYAKINKNPLITCKQKDNIFKNAATLPQFARICSNNEIYISMITIDLISLPMPENPRYIKLRGKISLKTSTEGMNKNTAKNFKKMQKNANSAAKHEIFLHNSINSPGTALGLFCFPAIALAAVGSAMFQTL